MQSEWSRRTRHVFMKLLDSQDLGKRQGSGSRGIMIPLECSRDRVIPPPSRGMIWRRLMTSRAFGR
jgi:hypothetical protein